MLPPKLDSIEYYNELKQKGNKLYILSNITEITYHYIKDNFNIIQNADGETCSCFQGVSKPDKQIYINLFNKYNIVSSESIFIDDTQKNIEIGEKLKLNCIKFNDIESLKEQVKSLEENLNG